MHEAEEDLREGWVCQSTLAQKKYGLTGDDAGNQHRGFMFT